MKTIYSILPEIKNEAGHHYEYALSVKKAAEAKGWFHAAWLPKDCEIAPLPDHWEKNLIPNQVKGLRKIPQNIFIYRKALRKLKDPSNVVLFFEHFRLTHLLALFLALIFNQRPAELWILYRYAPNQMTAGGKPHVYLLKAFSWIFKNHRLRLLTDSTLLKKQQEKLFNLPVDLLPIPHGKISTSEKFPKIEGMIDCWWPGGLTREEKGLKQIRAISESLQNSDYPIRLIAAKNADLKGVKATLFTENNMDRKTYEKWFNTSDITLLPYDPAVYHSGTSGIFVEAVLANTIPVVRDGTWMAYELKRHGINELILDWENPNLLKHLLTLKKSEKLEKMRLDYEKFHSLEGFTEALIKYS